MPDLLGLVVLTLLATLPFLTSHTDLALQRLFYIPDAANPWSQGNAPLWRWLYRFGPWPALLTALGAFGVLIAARWRPALSRWRTYALFLLMSLALGPGLLVNVTFKDHWGRPRPRQTTELGGAWPYQTFVEKGLGGRGKSFPCGHSSMGYYFVVFYFLWRRRHPGRALAAASFAAIYGTLIGTARMAAGGHFASDVAWSAVMTVAGAYFVYYLILRVPVAEDRLAAGMQPPPLSRWLLWASPPLAAFAVAMGLLATPSYTEFNRSVPALKPMRLTMDIVRCDVQLVFSDQPGKAITVTGNAQGFGWPGSEVRCEAKAGNEEQGRPVATVKVRPKGWFGELNGGVVMTVPAGTVATVDGLIREGDLTIQAAGSTTVPAMDLRIEDGRLAAPDAIQSRLHQVPETKGVRVRTQPSPPIPASR